MLMSRLVSPTQKKGAAAEAIAEKHLKQQGLALVEKNFSCKQGEIDLIMLDNDTLVFVEVRHRAQTHYGTAVESVTVSKQRKIIKTAILFMMQRGWYQKQDMRFDVVSIQGQLDAPQIQWIKQAFYGEGW